MDRKATNIVAYLTLVGWFLAYFVGDRYNSRFHLNQALVLNLFFLVLRVVSSVASWVLGWIPLVGWIVMLALNLVSLLGLVLWILGLVYAVQDKEQPVPLVGNGPVCSRLPGGGADDGRAGAGPGGSGSGRGILLHL